MPVKVFCLELNWGGIAVLKIVYFCTPFRKNDVARVADPDSYREVDANK